MSDTSAGQPAAEPTGSPPAPASTDPGVSNDREGVDASRGVFPSVPPATLRTTPLLTTPPPSAPRLVTPRPVVPRPVTRRRQPGLVPARRVGGDVAGARPGRGRPLRPSPVARGTTTMTALSPSSPSNSGNPSSPSSLSSPSSSGNPSSPARSWREAVSPWTAKVVRPGCSPDRAGGRQEAGRRTPPDRRHADRRARPWRRCP